MDSFHPNDNVVSLSTAPNPALAHIWANALREEGIPCHVVGDFLDAGIGDISGVQPQIWIKRQDMTHAQDVLERCMHSVVDGAAPIAIPGILNGTSRFTQHVGRRQRSRPITRACPS